MIAAEVARVLLRDTALATALTTEGYVVCDDFLPHTVVQALRQAAQGRHAEGQFQSAGIGRGQQHTQRADIRSDSILWLEDHDPHHAVRAYHQALSTLQGVLNQILFLGLFEFEGHFAHYTPGGFYLPHVDAFQGKTSRKVSCIFYLNADWLPAEGGQLRIYTDSLTGQAQQANAEFVDILPMAGRLVMFLSEQYWHEVRPATRTRWSATGWFRVRSAP